MLNKEITIKPALMGLMLLALLLAAGCRQEDSGDESLYPGSTAEKNVTLEVRIPGQRTPSTYGMSPAQENQVKELTVLAYKDNGSGLEELQEMIVAGTSDITSDAAGNVKVTLAIPAGSYSRLVVVANAGSQVGSLPDNSPLATLNAIKYTHADGVWDTGTPAPIPMTGQKIAGSTNGIVIERGRSQTFPGLQLVRMLARVDIVNGAISTFTLTEVSLYNFNKSGLLASDDTKYGASPAAPNLPASPDAAATLTYDFAALKVDEKMEGAIYAFEAAAPTNATISGKTAARIILKGTYNASVYYYPVDFTYDGTAGGTAKGAFMPVVRNHKYIFTITQVTGPGFASAADALASTGTFTNLTAQVFAVDEGFTDVYYNATDYLAVGGNSFDFGLEAVTAGSTGNIFTVKSTKAWTISCFNENGTTPATGGWLAVDEATGDANTSENVKILVTENTEAARTGIIKVVAAGFPLHTITVNQAPSKKTVTLINDDDTRGSITLNGSATLSQEVNYGEPVVLKGTPEDGYAIEGWYAGSSRISDANPYQRPIYDDITITAKWEVKDYIQIGLIKWAMANVDAPNTFAKDPWDSGLYYQIGHAEVGWSTQDPRVSTPNGYNWATTGGYSTWPGDENPCPLGWNMPDQNMFNMLKNVNYSYSSNYKGSGVAGMIFWDDDSDELFLPAAGCRQNSGNLDNNGTYGYYYMRNRTTRSWYRLMWNANNTWNLGADSQYYVGCSVRCVKN